MHQDRSSTNRKAAKKKTKKNQIKEQYLIKRGKKIKIKHNIVKGGLT